MSMEIVTSAARDAQVPGVTPGRVARVDAVVGEVDVDDDADVVDVGAGGSRSSRGPRTRCINRKGPIL